MYRTCSKLVQKFINVCYTKFFIKILEVVLTQAHFFSGGDHKSLSNQFDLLLKL